MAFKIVLIVIFCLAFPGWSFQQSKAKNNNKNSNLNGDASPAKGPIHWKAIAIIAAAVIFVVAIIYGTNFFYVCQMYFFEKTQRKYTKMQTPQMI
ncbi:hypothetical protein NQ317_009650 [Molorchus minor]|uniref:Uncharacterized protein n=1 Tax=Molorchus minor TaxID=1323400 RepID=A0ABQ9IZD0_9CUCU|nr:hypothetical protein NQ317_009650 [Molorchus minor]